MPTDFGDDWDRECHPDPDGDEQVARSAEDRHGAAIVEADPRARLPTFPVVDREAQAAKVEYGNGKVKRTRYRRVKMQSRKILIGLHQAGVERSEDRWGKTVQRVTCHRAIGPTGTRYRVHPLDVRIVCTNRLDRSPWHCIGIEQLGNMEGIEGSGNWYKPKVFGHGTLSAHEEESLKQEIAAIRIELRDVYGVQIYGIAPHRVAGRNRRGRPNRPICCGSAIWSRVGEWAAVEFGFRVPGPEQTFGGLPIHPEWHGEHYDRVRALGLEGL